MTTTPTPTCRVSTPAYYLGRPAALWQAALASRPTARTAPDASRTNTAPRPSPGNK
jgi:hypothetical protein